MEVKLRATVPEFVSVTVWAALAVPTVSPANVRLVGASVTIGAVTTGATAKPVSDTVCGEPVALSVTVTVPALVPATVGVNVIEMVQFAPTATLNPQLFVSA